MIICIIMAMISIVVGFTVISSVTSELPSDTPTGIKALLGVFTFILTAFVLVGILSWISRSAVDDKPSKKDDTYWKDWDEEENHDTEGENKDWARRTTVDKTQVEVVDPIKDNLKEAREEPVVKEVGPVKVQDDKPKKVKSSKTLGGSWK